MEHSGKEIGSSPDQMSSEDMPLHKTPAFREYLARTSNWGDEGLEPIRPWWRRLERVLSPLDGMPISKVKPLSDAQLIWLARCLQLDEKFRLDRFYQEIVVDPLQPAVKALAEIDERPKRLMKRRGRHRGPLGEDPLEIELSTLLIHRLRTLSLDAVTSAPEPKRAHGIQIAEKILMGLVEPCLVQDGPLRDHYYTFLPVAASLIKKGLPPRELEGYDRSPVDWICALFQAAVERALGKELRKDPSRAFWITVELWNAIGEQIDERSLRRILARRVQLRPAPDLIRRGTL